MNWKDCITDPPDCDTIVLVYLPNEASEPIWLAYLDDEVHSVWRFVEGHRCEPTHWAELPEPPS